MEEMNLYIAGVVTSSPDMSVHTVFADDSNKLKYTEFQDQAIVFMYTDSYKIAYIGCPETVSVKYEELYTKHFEDTNTRIVGASYPKLR